MMAAVAGEEEDRPPVSIWRHYFASEQIAEQLAEGMLAHERRFDSDFMA